MKKKAIHLLLLAAAFNPAYAEEQTPTVPLPVTPAIIDCNYSIPANQEVNIDTLTTWAKHAGVQVFTLSHDKIEQQLSDLQSCFTKQGWSGFHDALQKSGNLDTLKAQGMLATPQIAGTVQITPVKDNQWRATFPITVAYQSKAQPFTQTLSVDLLIGRKVSGDLGIMQVISSPAKTQSTP